MKIIKQITFILLIAFVVAACSGSSGAADGLTGAVWNISLLNGEPPVPMTSITAEFTEDGMVGGSAGCNNYSATYEVDGDQINFDMNQTATTLMACPELVMQQEAEYLVALAKTQSFEVNENELRLFDANGDPVAVFEAVSQDLAGTSWEVISFNNGKEAVVSVIIDTQITANFGEDGQLTGNAGCNDYFGPYETDGQKISMGTFGTTRMACQAPEGVMEQETQYLAALETADTYKVEGGRMNMRTAEGATVANFQRIRP